MSDVQPFREQADVMPVASLPGSDLDVFKPPLADIDFVAYEQRQAVLDAALETKDPDEIGAVVTQMSSENPLVGVTLNNLHNTILRGSLARLAAPLAVMTKTKVEADIPGFDFSGGVAPRAVFDGRDLKGSDFVDSVLPEISFIGADLTGSDFTNAVLTNADFTDANLAGVDLSGAYLVGVKGLDSEDVLRQINLSAARTVIAKDLVTGSLEHYLASHFGDATDIETIKRNLDPVPLAVGVTVPRLQTKRNLRGLVARDLHANAVDFSSSQLVGATIENMNATGAQFRNVMMSGSVILRSVMRDADLVNTWAPGLILEDVDLRGSRVTNANLVGAILRGVNLRDIVGLDAKDTNLNGIVVEDCILPQGYGYNGVVLEPSDKLKRQLES